MAGSPGAATAPRRPVLFLALFAGYPLAWAIGISPAIWAVAGAAALAWLLARRDLQIPPGFVAWALFLLVMGASALQVEGVGRGAVYVLRAAWYLSAGAMVVYLVNHRRSWMTAQTIVAGLLALWAACIVLGYAALVMPTLGWSSPLVRLLPAALADDPFIVDLTSPRLAEVQEFAGVTLGRPAAPFPYTNSWGSTVAILTPIAILALVEPRLRIPRGLVGWLLVASVVPVIASLNRGAWLSVGIGLAYAATLRAREQGSVRPLIGLTAAAALAVVVLVLTGALAGVGDKLETRTADSDARRTTLYEEAWSGALESPFIGFGTPRPSVVDPDGPPVGTHGQLWMTLYSHGLLGAVLYVGFFAYSWFRTPWHGAVHRWTKVALLVVLIQIPIYGHLPQQLFIGMALVALSVMAPRPDEDHVEPAAAPAPASHAPEPVSLPVSGG